MAKEVKIIPNIHNEYADLKEVVVGIADSFGGIPVTPFDPKSKEHVAKGTFPIEDDLLHEMNSFVRILNKYEVKVHRPKVINNLNQIYARDIAFVIDDKFVIANMIQDRSSEIKAIEHVLEGIDDSCIIRVPEVVRFEGGDVMPHNDIIFVGYEKEEDFKKYQVSRTNEAGVDFIKELFPDKHIMAFELKKSDLDPKLNALHLDCCFQPLGLGHCLIYKEGFKNEKDYFALKDLFGMDNCIDISMEEMYHMGSNVFSIKKDVLVSEIGQVRINTKLRELGYTVEEMKFSETSKMEGLFRCVTLPIHRS